MPTEMATNEHTLTAVVWLVFNVFGSHFSVKKYGI